ncbi:MAG: hydrogenase iron-sulfur subunit [Dehalococcoidia bacterium]|nr:hydrogenase iron-sulfur subunit [Dehalococcoidia bacterium]
MSDYEPKLVCFTCDFGWGYQSEKDALSSKIDHWVPIVCSGRIDTTYILDAFNAGADGVLILGCREGDCHFQDGNFEARKKVYLLQKLLEGYGIEKERLRMVFSLDPEGNTIPRLIEDMNRDIRKLGPVKKLPPLWLRSASYAE